MTYTVSSGTLNPTQLNSTFKRAFGYSAHLVQLCKTDSAKPFEQQQFGPAAIEGVKQEIKSITVKIWI